MSHASGVVIYGPANHRGEVDRGPTGALFAVHFGVPVLCTSGALDGPSIDWGPDRMILNVDPSGIARDIAVMVLTQLNGGHSPVPLYPFEPRDNSDSGLVFRDALYEAVDQAVTQAPPFCVHLVRFDHDLLGDVVADQLRGMGVAVETFDSNEMPARPR
jgi:hypothetical protein